jgi:hypothetical protein
MHNNNLSCARGSGRQSCIRLDYEDLKILVDRMGAVLHHQNKEIERLLGRDSSIKPDVALVWRVGHELIEQGVAELNALRQRMGLRLEDAVSTAEHRRSGAG